MLPTSVMDVMLELSHTELRLVAVCDDQHFVKDFFTNGDLRPVTYVTDCWAEGALTTPNGITLQAQSSTIDAKEILMKLKLTRAINLQDFY